jgi:hypothetical protein
MNATRISHERRNLQSKHVAHCSGLQAPDSQEIAENKEDRKRKMSFVSGSSRWTHNAPRPELMTDASTPGCSTHSIQQNSAGQSWSGKHWIERTMKHVAAGVGLLMVGVGIGFGLAMVFQSSRTSRPTTTPATAASPSNTVTITISATIDGSERFIFTPDNVWDEHGRWQPPKDVLFNGEPWTDLTTPPPQWEKLSRNLNLARAELVQRKGRDVIALERTADGFDLYFADTQMGAAPYEATISIPVKP